MKKESIQLIITFVLYTLLMLVIGSVIANNSKFNETINFTNKIRNAKDYYTNNEKIIQIKNNIIDICKKYNKLLLMN